MNPGPEFFRFGGIDSRKNAVSLIEDVCSECGSSSLRKRMEAGANELLTGKREGLVPGARVLYHKNRHLFGMGKVLGQTVLTAPAGADKTLKQGVHPAGGKAFSTQAVMWPRQYRRIINNQLKKKMIVFTEEKKFSREDVQELFLSVGWISGQYPGRLYKALMNSSTVVTAWDGDLLAGLVRVLDDSEMVAYMHYVLVHPAYQGRGIAGKMVEMVKEKYRDYLYLEIMPEESRNASFYEKHGFRVMADGVAMQLCNFSNRS